MALMSGKVYSNTGAPSNADGIDGDIYMQLDGFKTTYRKEGGSWVAVGSTLGAIPEFISGVGAPSNSLGTDGQYYRNSTNQDMYYKQGGTWALVGNLTGVAFQEVLVRAGIGKDLGTAPNLVSSGSLNTVIEAGEYAFTSAVTDTPYPDGLLKVWRRDSTYIYQLAQEEAVNGKLAHRLSNDGGATWGTWITSAFTTGSAASTFKVAPATLDEHATPKLQVEDMITAALPLSINPKAMGRVKNITGGSVQYFNSFNLNTVTRQNAYGWDVTFINALANADYIVVGTVLGNITTGAYGGRSCEPFNLTTTGFKIRSQWGGDNGTGVAFEDDTELHFAVF